MIDRRAETDICLPLDTVARVTHKDGETFVGRAFLTEQQGALVVSYADGTSVALKF